MRRLTGFECEGEWCAATIDTGERTTGLLIVSGGNEIRSGAHCGQAALAARIAARGYSVFRYDRRGIGDSEGTNAGFEGSAADLAAAVATFRKLVPQMTRLIAFGNCDAASALALFNDGLAIDHLLLANPWTLDPIEAGDTAPLPDATAIRARYWQRLKNPKSLLDLVTGRIDLKKLAAGLRNASSTSGVSALAGRMAKALSGGATPVTVLLARDDNTARAFRAAWNGAAFTAVRGRADTRLYEVDSGSHSFADAASRAWLEQQILTALNDD